MLWYHDSIWVGADRDKMNKAVFDSLKHGGQYVVVDHSALEGHGKSDVKTLHRIDALSVNQRPLRGEICEALTRGYARP